MKITCATICLCEESALESLSYKFLKHGGGNVEIGDNAVFKRSYGNDRAGGASDDVLGFLTDIAAFIRSGIHGNY